MHHLEIKVLNIIDSRCNHEVCAQNVCTYYKIRL